MPGLSTLFSPHLANTQPNTLFMVSAFLLHAIFPEDVSGNVAIHVTCDVTSRWFVSLKPLFCSERSDWKSDDRKLTSQATTQVFQ